MAVSDKQPARPAEPPLLRALLASARGALQPPLRAEIFGLQRFAEHGRSLALTHRAARASWRSASFFPRVRSNIGALREAQAFIGAQVAAGQDISPAAEWLVDNFHLIEAQLVEIHEGMPRSYFRALPVLLDEPLAGLPRIYGVAWAFVAHTDGAFDEELLIRFLGAYQGGCELGMGEVWALPTTLRVVLIESLRRLAEREATQQAAREWANLLCDRIDQTGVAELERALAGLALRGVGAAFLAQMAQRLHDRAAPPHGHVDDWLRQAMPDPELAQAQQNADQTADNLSVSNAVGSLRAIGDADWPAIVDRCSPLIGLLLGSPLFGAEHVGTRDQTLHGIERLARRSGRGELAVARTLLGLLDPDVGTPGAAAGHWIDGPGRPALARALGLTAPWAWLTPGRRRRVTLAAYLGALALGTWIALTWLLRHFGVTQEPAWLKWAGVAAMVFPASEAMVALMNRLISESARPRPLPRLGLANGLLAEHRVMVVVPAFLSSAASTQALAHRLLLHHLANPECQTQFALLSDWPDADSERVEGDDERLAEATQAVAALNAQYGAPAPEAPRFIVLHRERRFSTSEQRWIGWERKRGKLESLVDALAGGDAGLFIDLGEASRIAAATRYIVTLDSDTELPPGRLRELVGVAAHPRNAARLDRAGRRVTGGYGILQPRISTPLPSPSTVTPYHRLFAGQCGIDPYSAASSEVYQDLFGEGSFSGKGLLDVAALHAVLSRRLPEGRVLSHDLLEGALARCATVNDLTLIEDSPFNADVAAARVHRWTRGDWQLLPFLLAPWRWRLGAVNRWKMFDNLRRSLVAPFSLALLLLALAGFVVTPWAALALVAAAFSAGPLMGALAGFAPPRRDLALRHFGEKAAIELGRTLGAGLWQLVQLMALASASLDAIARALYRMLLSRRHLLQWTPSASAQAAASTRLGAVLRRHRAEPLLALLLLAALLALATPTPALAVVLCVVWAAAPLAVWWASRPQRPHAGLAAPVRAHLEGIARDTWRFFERCVSADDHHLPPDNLQTSPHDMLARRTSPTNIGLYLLSVACARRFGWIDTPELLRRLEATLATLALLQRHRGHFLNWYDTQTLAPLLPIYVSTVDSGNLSGHLLALAQACLELAAEEEPADTAPRLRALAASCRKLAWEPDFDFLYHRRRHLLHIGLRVAELQLDSGFYDLLASESRLTSLIAIAKGDVPVRHWAALGRPFYAIGATAALRSWSGSMFEYLMPCLVLEEPHGSVLREACGAAVQEQIDFASAHALPWGNSESAYAARDHSLAYQYAPQGVPRLALRRTPPDELVVAPYATALAAQIAPRRADANFIALEALAARESMGFIEALDFTPARQGGPGLFTPVQTFMAHHQGMTIVALANVLLDGAAQRWGMADPRLEAMASLLHERAPRAVSALRAPLPAAPSALRDRRAPGLMRELLPGMSAVEPTLLLSNGHYHVGLRANGAGFSRLGDTGITRTRDDALRDACGSFFYLRWDRQPQAVSITQHPAPDPQAHYRAVFHADRVCFDAAWSELQAHATVWVSPEDDIEFRRIEIANLGERSLDLELISAFELTLATAGADAAHPAFSSLFVRAAWQPGQQALVFERTPRAAGDASLFAAHFVAESDAQLIGTGVQTDRQRWQGRNRGADRPLASFDAVDADAAGPEAALVTGLDPVCALALRLRIAPGAKARLTFATAACDDRGRLHAVIDKYRQASHVQRASLMSTTLAGIRARELRLGAEDFAALQTLNSALLQNHARERGAAAPSEGVCDRRLLWRLGISGERPLILVTAGAMQGLGLVRSLAQALRLWEWNAVACDLVIVNAEPASYQMPLQRELSALHESHPASGGASPAVAVMHVLRAEDLSAGEMSTLHALARVRLRADGRSLPHHVRAWIDLHEQAFDERQAVSGVALNSLAEAPPSPADARFTGGFEGASGDFAFDVGAALRPPRPWINVLANPGFGTQVSEAGGGYTWAINSRMNQITGWSNDPVADPPGEWFLLQDRRTRQVWSVSPSAAGDALALYRVTHAQGESRIVHRRGDVEVAVSWCVDAEAAIKQVRLLVANRGTATQQLRAVGIVEWVMGAQRGDRATVDTALDGAAPPGVTALLCTQRERGGGFGGGTAFLALAGKADSWTCDRRECFDSRGRFVLPDHFGQARGSGLDPCAALSTPLTLLPGETQELVFLIGHGASVDAARALLGKALATRPAQRIELARAAWNRLLAATVVATPDPLFDVMVNRWLLYQVLACRIWAKAGFYQAGGATGFRDQLQDAMALAWAAPQTLRAQILLCASRQFPEGDVQHWWHAPDGAGVRTRFSDDLLWLPEACAHYFERTGDATLLDESVAFIEGAPIPEGAEDAYYVPATSSEQASVWEHAARAIDRSLGVGVHGLPLMGGGDWNDGMNRVGIEGRGESVWLGWFLCRLVRRLAPLARSRGEAARAARWEAAAQGWQAALLAEGWDGQWFRRAFFDDGQVLGSEANPECRIDLIAQAWAVLSGVAPQALQRQAMAAVEAQLVDAEAGLIRLLDPPLAHSRPSAGYIQAYPGGVRENGGQYAHAGVWALMAEADLARSGAGDGSRAYRDFKWLSPAHRAADAGQGAVYGLEPYVMAGDICSQPPYVGRGGWSWYTGSAAWMHRAAVESLFGLVQRADTLRFEPCLPAAWPRAEMTLRRDGRALHFVLQRFASRAEFEALAIPAAATLWPGKELRWRETAVDARFIVPLTAVQAD